MKKFIALGVLLGLVIIGSAGADLLLTKTANTTVFSEVSVGGGGGDTFWGTNAIAAQSISNVFPGRVYINGTINGVKVYRALLTQSGTANPTVTVLENSIGAIVVTRFAQGFYNFELTGAFPAGKCYASVTVTRDITNGDWSSLNRESADIFQIMTTSGGGAADGVLNATIGDGIEIRVYP